jgi:uncharacterized protein (TIGR01777 family)
MLNNNNHNGSSVLITGGSGLVGRYLTSSLLAKGYKVSHLSRKANQFGKVRVYRWDPGKLIIDPGVFDGIDCIINLAGENLGEKRWTSNRKKAIISSRVDSTRFLYETIYNNKISIKSFISASAIGYYGTKTTDKIYHEDDSPVADFLGSTCKEWEEKADLFLKLGVRTVKIRTAVVLEKNDSAFSNLMKSAKFGFLVQVGNGKQFMPWIHITDLCNIYIKAIEDKSMTGPYNAVSPHHVSHKDFIKVLSQIIKRPVLFPPVPAFLVRSIFGEMADLILKGSRISPQKIINTGYNFTFSNLDDALTDIIHNQ